VLAEFRARLARSYWSLVLLIAAALGTALLALLITSAALITVWVGLPMFICSAVALRAFAGWHRWWAGNQLGRPIAPAYLTLGQDRFLARGLVLARDPSTWRDLSWLLFNSTLGIAVLAGAVTESVLGLVFWWLPRSALLTVYAQLVRLLLTPGEHARLAQRVQHLTTSRTDTLDAQEAELRRLERDLHDGPQARLVSVGMSLGLAEEMLDGDPGQARRLLAEARQNNAQVLADLRDLVRGIHPPVLSDRGLAGAVEALVLTSPVPVQVHSTLSGRLPAPVESAAYFAVAEALANAIKHGQAERIGVSLTTGVGVLRAVIHDDGVGGAHLTPDGGLRGIQRRLAAFDGTLTLSSPRGGPTVVTLELPCA